MKFLIEIAKGTIAHTLLIKDPDMPKDLILDAVSFAISKNTHMPITAETYLKVAKDAEAHLYGQD